jgi:hypothetical protein
MLGGRGWSATIAAHRILREVAQAAVILVIGVCLLEYGCPWLGVKTIWAAQTQSPDGRWVAMAKTELHVGGGLAGCETIVYLKRSGFFHYFRRPTVVLEFLPDEYQNVPLDTIDLKMKWQTLSHLDVSYYGPARRGYYLKRYLDVDITVRDLSRKLPDPPSPD